MSEPIRSDSSDGRIASLVGAPDDATVEVSAAPGSSIASYRVSHAAVETLVGWFERSKDRGLEHTIGDVEVKPEHRGRGAGARIHGRQVHWGIVHGVDRLKLDAARSDVQFGHLVWPAFGYDGPLPDAIRNELPGRLRNASTLQDLLDDDEGRDWWQAMGRTIALIFDLADGSRSRDTWNEYWNRRIRNATPSPGSE